MIFLLKHRRGFHVIIKANVKSIFNKTLMISNLRQLSPTRNLFLLICVLFCSLTGNAITATEIYEKGKTKIESAKSLSADFIMSINGRDVKGRILTKGNKFAILNDVSSNWYNGTELYTYVPSEEETTVFEPETDELPGINPLLYLKDASQYKLLTTKTKKDGIETVILVPRKAGGTVKRVSIDLDKTTYLPKVIDILTGQGENIKLVISNIRINGNIPDSEFVYPSSRYPAAKIIDMR